MLDRGSDQGHFYKYNFRSSDAGVCNTAINEAPDLYTCLHVARQIQQNLLPRTPPRIDGLDVYGECIYCNELGGDFFDYLNFKEVCCRSNHHLGIVVGDVSGHGICSALFMSTIRAYLRCRATHPGDLGENVTSINRLVAKDTDRTGDFMSLFYLDVHPGRRRIRWVRAGHDPAILYDPSGDAFGTLNGDGIALGVNPNFVYTEKVLEGIKEGQIIVIGTDGIWETHNQKGGMFGKRRLQEVIRAHAAASARQITKSIIDATIDFRQGAKQEDDVTLVVIKIISQNKREQS